MQLVCIVGYCGTTFLCSAKAIRFLERLSTSLLLIRPYQVNICCIINVDIWHTLASYCTTWFLTWSFAVLPIIHRSIVMNYMHYLLVFLSDRPTLMLNNYVFFKMYRLLVLVNVHGVILQFIEYIIVYTSGNNIYTIILLMSVCQCSQSAGRNFCSIVSVDVSN